jgi:hypothetical protein
MSRNESVLSDQETPTHIGTTKRVGRSAVLILTGLALASRTDAQSPTSEPTGLYAVLGFLPILILAVVGLVWWLIARRNRGSIDRYLSERAKKLDSSAVPPTSMGIPAESNTQVRPPASSSPADATSPIKPSRAPELSPYDVNAPCPACGVVGAKSRFKNGGGFDSRTGRRFDFILRKCGNCGYQWKEHPLGDQTHVG